MNICFEILWLKIFIKTSCLFLYKITWNFVFLKLLLLYVFSMYRYTRNFMTSKNQRNCMFLIWIKTCWDFLILKVYNNYMFAFDMKNTLNLWFRKTIIATCFLNERDTWNFMILNNYQNFMFFIYVRKTTTALYFFEISEHIIFFRKIVKTSCFSIWLNNCRASMISKIHQNYIFFRNNV